jgi:hypothetical protein
MPNRQVSGSAFYIRQIRLEAYSNRRLKNVMSAGAGKIRQNLTEMRSLCVINEYFEEDFNAVLSSAIVFQLPVRISP